MSVFTETEERVARAVRDEYGSRLCFDRAGEFTAQRQCERGLSCACKDVARAAIAALPGEPVAWSTRDIAKRIEETLNAEFGVTEGYGSASWTAALHLYATPSLPTPPDAEKVRGDLEKVARIVNPAAWDNLDGYVRRHDADRAAVLSQHKPCQYSLDEARRILAALSHPSREAGEVSHD